MNDLITDLDTIQRLAVERHAEFEVMRYLLELNIDITDAELDTMVEAIANPITEQIDCTQCGNCCRSLHVYVTSEDVERLADGLHTSVENVKEEYVDLNNPKKVGEWGKFKAHPCAFLKGNLCSVYAHRPDSCRTYPGLTPHFRWILEDIIDGAAICPIIYNVLDAMVKKVDALYEQVPGNPNC